MAKAVHDPTAAHYAVAAVAIGAVIGAIAVGTVISPPRTSGETERKAGAEPQADATPTPTAAAPMTAMPTAVTAPPGIRSVRKRHRSADDREHRRSRNHRFS